jgi:hypothetical protein
MYLPFFSTAAIFVGGVFKWLFEKRLERQPASAEVRVRAENTGTLLSSGFIAGESLMAVLLAFIVLGSSPPPLAWLQGFIDSVIQPMCSGILAFFQSISPAQPYFWLGLLIYPVLAYLLAWLPLKAMKSSGMPATKID